MFYSYRSKLFIHLKYFSNMGQAQKMKCFLFSKYRHVTSNHNTAINQR